MTGSRLQRSLLLASGALYLVMWVGGIIAYVFRGGPGPHEAWTAPAFLALAAVLVLGTSRRREAGLLVVIVRNGGAWCIVIRRMRRRLLWRMSSRPRV